MSVIFRNTLFGYLFLLASSSLLPAQQPGQPAACHELPALRDFFVVDEVRGRLQREIPELLGNIKEIRELKIPQVGKAEKDLAEATKKIEVLNAKANKSPDDLKQLENLESLKTSIEGFLGGKNSEFYQNQLTQFETDLAAKVDQRKCVNDALAGFNVTPEQDFKRTMSIIFALLIGLVIVGFFVMAWKDDTVRKAIFSGQTGLQFVTVFSIVIAIILFGITGILEDKELAALLGGLSGYILGRVTTDTKDPGGTAKGNAAAKVTVSPSSANLSQNSPTKQLMATALDSKSRQIDKPDLKWASTDPNVASVDQDGLITWVMAGECQVTASNGKTVSNPCKIMCV